MKHRLIINLVGELSILSLSLLLIFGGYQLDIFIFCNILWVLGTLLTQNYYINRLPGALINLINLSKWFALFFLIVFVYIKLFHESEYSNSQLIKFLVFLYSTLVIWRMIVFFLIKHFLLTNTQKTNIVIIGVSVNSIHLKDFIEKKPQYGINLLGFFTDKVYEDLKTQINVIGNYSEITDYCIKNNVSEIICSIDKVSQELLTSLIDFSENNLIHIKILPDAGGVYGRSFVTTFLEYIPLLILRKNPFDELSNKLIKRFFDVTFSLFIILFILSWLMPLIALLIIIDSRGPIFFVQERTGLLNKTFKCFKFRTMKLNNSAHINQATKNDTRITKIGSFLRKSSLDELPQFFNVLVGNMSVVGPRPHMLKHTAEYSQIVDKYMLRHLVKPGITGLSQVMGYRGETQHDLHLMKMRVRMDRFYIENWSFYLDLKVIYATLLTLLKKDDKVY